MVQIYCGIPGGTLYPIGTQLAETIPSPHPHQTHLRLYPGERLLFRFNPAIPGQEHLAWALGRLLPPGP